ncbi:hypothetical protein DXG03_006499 [Asterophora parasitica]|uniref:N-acetyltransferase domain-containing protein n=1 Tax=Asterophora parasitica TaxID=117018 RepID=A0A9P7GDG4_9AGAR|nr:hypothetical protein DXG03_006499 [Asterophora parasitica]
MHTTGTFKFTYDGERVLPEQTPAELGMEDGDQIDAHLGQSNILYSARTMSLTSAPYDVNFCFPVKDLESERVKLTPFVPSKHAEALYALPQPTYDYLPYGPFATSADFVTSLIEGRIDPDRGSCLFAVFDKTKAPERGQADGALAGVIGYWNGTAGNLAVEIAWVLISPRFQRTHVTSHAIGLLLRYALELPESGGLGLRRVVWAASPLNVASVAAAERMGFQKEGVLRWVYVMPAHKRVGNGRERREGDPKKELLGRDAVVLGLCWDDWVDGGRERVAGVMARRG